MKASEQGFNVVELLVVLAIAGVMLSLAAPPFFEMSADFRVRLAAQDLMGTLRLARAYAVRYSANVAVRFDEDEAGNVSFALYRDGDGDGVRNRDIDSGVDPRVVPPRRLAHFGGSVGFGFPPGPPPRDPSLPSRRLRKEDPVRFNDSDLASFGPLGTSTPGSLYVTDGRRRLAVVRVFARTGKVRILVYDFAKEEWH
jgi:prepilin-type N-terminal cleavage/methylation domain-containing protein